MRYLIVFVVTATLIMSEGASVSDITLAQTQNRAQEKADNLRGQLSEVEAKQAELQTRRQDLDEQLKPENIEKTLAGVGSTRPEDLREQRRRQLEIERNGVQKQLDLLATSHTRLQAAIAQADADAYRQSAAPVTPAIAGPSTNSSSTTSDSTGAITSPAPVRPRRVRKKRSRKPKRTTSSAIPFAGRPEPVATAGEPAGVSRSSRGGGGLSVVPFSGPGL